MSQFFWPRASFWRPWLVALALSAVVLFVFINIGHAGEYRRHHHRHHHHHRYHRHHALRHHHTARAMRFQSASVIGSGQPSNIAIAMRFLGRGNPTGSRGPWCGDFLNLVEHLAGRAGIPSRLAIDWRRYGRPAAAVPGAIAVFPGHVALVMGRVGDRIRIISGNWAHRVGIGWANIRSAVAFRYP